ncbi:hypothetical protein GN956_G4152 [Arapaima gigas]
MNSNLPSNGVYAYRFSPHAERHSGARARPSERGRAGDFGAFFPPKKGITAALVITDDWMTVFWCSDLLVTV